MKIKVSPSILQSFSNFLGGKYNETQETLLDRINKKAEYLTTDAQQKGTAFHKLTENTAYIADISNGLPSKVKYQWWDFDRKLVDEVINLRRDFYHEQYIERLIETSHGPVKLYGFTDDIGNGICQDLKTTSNYYDVKFDDQWQWKVYLYIANCHTFNYLITDFTNIYWEQYQWYPEIIDQLRSILDEYCYFIELNKEKIDLKYVTYE